MPNILTLNWFSGSYLIYSNSI